MRQVLINWIAEVTELFMFKREVFHTAINYLDRFLDAVDLEVSKNKFQLLGLTCLYSASKFEVGEGLMQDSSYKLVDDFLELAKNIYTRMDIF